MDGDWLEGVYRPAGTVIHGHSTTESVYWNTYGTARGRNDIVESRAWGWGYVIGTRGPKPGVERGTQDGTAPEDFLEGVGQGDSLVPESLYLDQLARRLGTHLVPHQDVLAEVTALRFTSRDQGRYALEYTAALGGPAWDPSGYVVAGNGDQRYVFDPTPGSAARAYRLAEAGTPGVYALDLFTEDIDPLVWNVKIAPATPESGNVVVPAPTPINDGQALRMYDLSASAKPELQGELAAALTVPFRLDFLSYNQSTNPSTAALRFRMANAGKSVTSESRAAFSLSWQADGRVTAKYQGLADGNAGDVDTLVSAPLVGVHAVTLVVNGGLSAPYAYDVYGRPRTLDPLHYDVYVDGILLNEGSDPDVARGLSFTLSISAGDYDPGLGLQRFGLHGSSNAAVDPDYLFDTIVLRVGDAPSPATFREITTGYAPGLAFASASDVVYAIQASTNGMDWMTAGMEVHGNGAERILFDPAGFSTTKTYRVIQTQ
jgi:hypothetical protein